MDEYTIAVRTLEADAAAFQPKFGRSNTLSFFCPFLVSSMTESQSVFALHVNLPCPCPVIQLLTVLLHNIVSFRLPCSPSLSPLPFDRPNRQPACFWGKAVWPHNLLAPHMQSSNFLRPFVLTQSALQVLSLHGGRVLNVQYLDFVCIIKLYLHMALHFLLLPLYFTR